MYRKSNNDTAFFVVLFILLGIIVCGMTAMFLHREDAYVVIDDAWWVSYTYVKYDTYECDWRQNTDGDLVQDCGWETNVRCVSNLVERDLPVTYPQPGCIVRSSDYVTNSTNYIVKYHEAETTEQVSRSVNRDQWLLTKDHSTFIVTTNGFGNIVSMKRTGST